VTAQLRWTDRQGYYTISVIDRDDDGDRTRYLGVIAADVRHDGDGAVRHAAILERSLAARLRMFVPEADVGRLYREILERLPSLN